MERAKDDLLNRIVWAVDRQQRRRLGIWEIANDPECFFRLARGRAHRAFVLPDGLRVSPGDPVAILHLWGERVPALPPEGANLAWARRTQRILAHSMRAVAREVRDDPRLADAVAFGNDTTLPYTTGSVRMFERIGFTFAESEQRNGLLARLVARGAQLWTRLLRRAYNAPSLRSSDSQTYVTRPMWMSRTTLLDRYDKPSPPTD